MSNTSTHDTPNLQRQGIYTHNLILYVSLNKEKIKNKK